MSTRKIYLAARYSRHIEMQGYADELRAMGYEITSRWINGDHQISDAGLAESEESTVAERERFARDYWEDLGRSDICISFTEQPRSAAVSGARHVEFGIAYSRFLHCIVVGPRENVFHCLPRVDVYDTWAQAHTELKRIAESPAIFPVEVSKSKLDTNSTKEGDMVSYKDRIGKVLRFREHMRWSASQGRSLPFVQARIRWSMNRRPFQSWVDVTNIQLIERDGADE